MTPFELTQYLGPMRRIGKWRWSVCRKMWTTTTTRASAAVTAMVNEAPPLAHTLLVSNILVASVVVGMHIRGACW